MAKALKNLPLLRDTLNLRCPLYQQKALIYSKLRGMNHYEWLHKIRNTEYKVSTKDLKHGLKDLDWKNTKANQQFDEKLRAAVGVELSVAHFIVARGGAVKFVGSDRWVENERHGGLFGQKSGYSKLLPQTKIPGYNVEAIDATGMDIMYDSFDMLEDLSHVKYLSVSHCPYFDDWCFERLMPISETLMVLDVSGCPQVTERGLAAVHKLPKLMRLICNDMPRVKNPALLKLLLEEVLPNCIVDGLADYTDPEELEKSEPLAEPVFCVPPLRLAQVTTSADWIYLDDLEEDSDTQKLLQPGDHTDSKTNNESDTKRLPQRQIQSPDR